jgi:hypothetical protein
MSAADIFSILTAVEGPLLLIGGFAVNAYGYTRNTLGCGGYAETALSTICHAGMV